MTSAILPIVMTVSLQITPVSGSEFARLDGPIRAHIEAACELVMMDSDGRAIARAQAEVGDVDLAKIFPEIRAVPHAVRVQAVVKGVATDSPLVVVPLDGRPTLRTIQDVRPDGTTKFTRIIGWGDSLLHPSNVVDQQAAQAWAKADVVPRSGFRVEIDRDVIMETTAGTIRFAMRPDHAPNSARNFVDLAASGFYDGTIIHRVVPKGRGGKPFVVQGGDPTGTGDGGPGYDLALEPSKLQHEFGVLSMARNDWPDSAGSQWFIALTREETARLDGQYCAFGEAVEGAAAILEIERGAIADPESGRPAKPVIVKRATAVPAAAWVPGSGRVSKRVIRAEVSQ